MNRQNQYINKVEVRNETKCWRKFIIQRSENYTYYSINNKIKNEMLSWISQIQTTKNSKFEEQRQIFQIGSHCAFIKRTEKKMYPYLTTFMLFTGFSKLGFPLAFNITSELRMSF